MARPQTKRHHNCPVDECAIGLPIQVLMCPPHWRSVPKPLRHDVTRTWSRARLLSGSPARDVGRRAAVADYLTARDAAVQYANGVAAR